MKHFAIRTLVNAIVLWVTAALVPGIHLASGSSSMATKIESVLLVAVIFGVVNALVKPVVKLLSMPVIIATLGLFAWVVNALMLELTSWLAGKLGLDFRVDSFFWAALLGSVVLAFVSMLVNILLPDADEL